MFPLCSLSYNGLGPSCTIHSHYARITDTTAHDSFSGALPKYCVIWWTEAPRGYAVKTAIMGVCSLLMPNPFTALSEKYFLGNVNLGSFLSLKIRMLQAQDFLFPPMKWILFPAFSFWQLHVSFIFRSKWQTDLRYILVSPSQSPI